MAKRTKFVAVSGDLAGKTYAVTKKTYGDFRNFNLALELYSAASEMFCSKLMSDEDKKMIWDKADAALQVQYDNMVANYGFSKYHKRTTWTFVYPE